jgi:S-adenosylmethionine hydrolase
LLASEISNTFHGRDVFAPVAAALSLGIPLHEIGVQISAVDLLAEPAQFSPSSVESKIIHIDRFGNCVTGIRRSALPNSDLPDPFVLHCREHQIRHLQHFYLEAEPDQPFVIWGSIGFLEISFASSSAVERLGLSIGDRVWLEFK